MDIVLEENPNPRGMAVRVFRHLAAKDARRIGRHAVAYLERCTDDFSFDELVEAERSSYRTVLLDRALYDLFSVSRKMRGSDVGERFDAARLELEHRGLSLAGRQLDLLTQNTH
jgi:hypothetical protein